jgi:hypothetical protein
MRIHETDMSHSCINLSHAMSNLSHTRLNRFSLTVTEDVILNCLTLDSIHAIDGCGSGEGTGNVVVVAVNRSLYIKDAPLLYQFDTLCQMTQVR